MKKLLFLFLMLFSIASHSQECDINAYEADEFLGKEATVCGEVSQIYSPKYTKGNPTYLNMGGEFPNHTFTVVIWGDNREKMEINLEDLKGKKLAVTGIVREYGEKPQIVVKSDSQIREF